MAEPFIGQIIMFGGNFAIRSFAFCNGQLLPISSNTALFSLLGTIYGGDGQTTFALPDLRARAPVHPGNAPGFDLVRLGEKYGVQEISLSVAQLPPHSHAISGGLSATTAAADQAEPEDGAKFAKGETDVPRVGTVDSNIYTQGSAGNVTLGGADGLKIGNTGSGIPVPIEGPRLAVNFEIALTGLYPSHN